MLGLFIKLHPKAIWIEDLTEELRRNLTGSVKNKRTSKEGLRGKIRVNTGMRYLD